MTWKQENMTFDCTKQSIGRNAINEEHIVNLINLHLSYEDYLNSENMEFFGRTYSNSVWISDIKHVYLLARKNLLRLEQASVKGATSHQDTDFSEVRKQICELLSTTRNFITRYKDENSIYKVVSLFKNLLKIAKRLHDFPDYLFLNCTAERENMVNNATYNLLHLCLDVYWVILTFEYKLEADNTTHLEVFEKNLHVLLGDLLYISLKKFDKVNINQDSFKETPFLCPCVKEMWLLIYLHVQKLFSQGFCCEFWHYFNTAINQIFMQSNDNNNSLKCVWILYHVATVQGYNSSGIFIGPENYNVTSNYKLLEQCLRNITNGTEKLSEQQFCTFLHLLTSLHIEWWSKDSTLDLIQLLWEHFYRRLNDLSSPHQNSARIGNILKSYNFIASTNDILKYDVHSISGALSSFELFLCLLHKHLTCTPMHWQRLKGRIYSKLPVQKLATFTENGLYNLVQLFFVLADVVSFTELTDRFLSLLTQLPTQRTEVSPVIWCAHMSLIRMHCIRGISLQTSAVDTSVDICTQILLLVQSASRDRSRGHLIKIFIEELENILNDDDNLHCDEHVLFTDWMVRYLQWCSHTEVCSLLQVLLKLVEKIQHMEDSKFWRTTFDTHLVPALINLTYRNDSPQQVADVAAALVALDKELFKRLLEHMTGDMVSVSLSSKFLKSLLEPQKFELALLDGCDIFLMKAWVRIAMLSMDKADVMDLTYLLSQLPNWSATMGSFDIACTDDPLFAVIKVAGGRLALVKSVQSSAELKKWFETYFGRMDKWIAPVLAAAERGEHAPLVMKLYTLAALMFSCCASSLYIKNTSTCLLHRLTSSMLLPASVLTNKKPVPIILSALKKTWHLFVKGFCQLDYKLDCYIQRTLKDMVIRYVPHMYESTSPIIKCMDDDFSEDASVFILEKMVTTFLTFGSKRPHENAMQALKLFLEIFRAKCGDSSKTEILIKTVLPSILEHRLHTDDFETKRNISYILYSTKPLPESIVKGAIASFIEKNLAFHSSLTFDIIESLSIVIPNHIYATINDLERAIARVEQMRGVGFDHSLRKGLQKIQGIFKQSS